MPQPFKGLWTYDQDSLRQRPHLAARLGIITSLWAQVEFSLGMLFSRTLGADSVVGTTMYLTIINDGSRDSVMLAGAKEKLDDETFSKFEQLLHELKAPRKLRNTVAHGCWAISDEAPNSLILIDIKKMVKMFSFQGQNLKPLTPELTKYADAIKNHSESQLEYTEKDFDNIEQKMKDAATSISQLHHELMKPFFEQLNETQR